MRLTLAEPKLFKDSINIISDLVSEVQISFEKDSLEIVAMDPANVAMVVFRMFASSFSEYELKKAERISINLAMLKQVLRRIKGSETLTMTTSESKLEIRLKAATTRTFSLPIIDSDDEETRVPDLEFPVSVALDSSALNDAIEDVDVISDSVAFIVDDGTFTLHAEGDLSHVTIEMPKSEEIKIVVEASSNPIRSKYSVEYLKKMIQGSKLADRAVVHFNKDYPLKIDYTTVDVLSMVFILAPRVDND